MSNMSYCRFENTVDALVDCYEALKEDGIQHIEAEASRREAPKVMELIELCREITEDFNEGEFDPGNGTNNFFDKITLDERGK